ncbi:DUF4241 domain-containing protein [Kitasatospora sp. NPDC053057]|uniref:DUF4241 domain-containing protein n=1 Tax=Kitasatospora sp. NPDC053057 TaxID=3364062 RepID=UPI0037C53CD5
MLASAANTLEVRYCEGWDPKARAGAGLIPEREARRRDGAGEPYAVLVGAPGADGRPLALLQVDWGHGYLGLFLFDGQARRTRQFEYRQLEPGRLHLRQYQERRPASAEEPEFVERGWTFTLTVHPDGTAKRVLDSGGSLHTSTKVPSEHHTVAKAEFGKWTAYLDGRLLGLDGPINLVSVSDGAHEPAPVAAPRPPLWQAPQPARPRHLEVMFTPGSRLTDRHGDIAVISEPEHAGLLHLPTGSVLAADPHTIDDRDQPFTVTVPPGDYPVLIATMCWEGRQWGETLAAMLRISERPTAGWELALRPGQDSRLLGDGHFFGFGVDTGTACFLDASGRQALTEQIDEENGGLAADGGSPYPEVREATTGTNLIAYPSGMGDGTYPVWIGRDADGAVTCFVADMLILHHATVLETTATSTAAVLRPFGRSGAEDRREAAFSSPGATAEFIAAEITDTEQFAVAIRRR